MKKIVNYNITLLLLSIILTTVGRGTVTWRSIKQSCIIDSTIEAKYVAACEAAKEAVWLR